MGKVAYSEQSRSDIFDIWAQLAIRSGNLADFSLDRIEARCRQLADFPQLGPLRRDIGQGARALLSDRWVIVYRIVDEGVSIVRIVDGARDLTKLNLPNE